MDRSQSCRVREEDLGQARRIRVVNLGQKRGKLLGKARTYRLDTKLIYGNVRGQAGNSKERLARLENQVEKNAQVEEQRGRSLEIGR